MNQDRLDASERLTILVFKDHFAARTFQIPLKWLSKMGLLLASFILLTLILGVTSVRYYRMLLKTDPGRVRGLELEISELRTALKNYETGTPPVSQATRSETTPPQIQTTSQTDLTQESNSITPSTPDETQLTETQGTPVIAAHIFSALPMSSENRTLPDPASLPFSIQSPRFSWKGTTLNVKFALQYIKNDRGNQQGRIILLARGPSTLLTYPSGIMNHSGQPDMIQSQKGEYFSVSRYREVNATFETPRGKESITELEVILLNKEGQLIRHQIYPLQSGVRPEKNKNQTTPEVKS